MFIGLPNSLNDEANCQIIVIHNNNKTRLEKYEVKLVCLDSYQGSVVLFLFVCVKSQFYES